jgi:hypothetical protein
LSEEKKKNLWYDFDNWSQWKSEPQIEEAERVVMDYSSPTNKPFGMLTSISITEDLNAEAGNTLSNSLKKLVPGYIEMFNTYFGQNFDQETTIIESFPWHAFVNFGLGVLHDPRYPRVICSPEPTCYGMHVMDSGNFGYFLWHRFNWIASSVNLPPEVLFTKEKGLYLDRLVGLAAELHSTSRPNQSKIDGSPPDHPPNGENISMDEIRSITNKWSNLDFERIEQNLSQLRQWTPSRPGDQLSHSPKIFTSRAHLMD